MARVSSNEKLPKRIDDYLIYNLDNQFVMRKISGFTRKQILNSTKYARVRENAAEFGHVSRLCKALRLSLITLLPRKDSLAICNTLTKLMRRVLVCDTFSKRGERQLALAFENSESKTIVKGYDFNPNSLFRSIFRGSYRYDEGRLQFDDLVFSEVIVFPDDANFVGFRLSQLQFDFRNAIGDLVASSWHLFERTSSTTGFTIAIPDTKATNGVLFVLLEMQFYTYDGSNFLPCDDRSKVLVVLHC
jgi:hypothetical protein